MATKTFKIGLSNTDKQNMAQDVYERLIAMCFDEYDSTKTYNKGDFVVYESPADTFKLYKCNSDEVTGAWDSTKWDLATFQDLVDDIENAVAFVNDKANVDGNYPTMTVGVADQLSPYDDESGDDQDEPFSFQATGTGNGSQPDFATGAIALMKEKQGNTVVVNQLAKEFNTTNWTFNAGVTGNSITNGVVTFTATAQYGSVCTSVGNGVAITNGHKYLLSIIAKTSKTGGQIRLSNAFYLSVPNTNNSFQQVSGIVTANVSQGYAIYIQDNNASDWAEMSFKNFILIDLTQWFDDDIPQDLLDNPSNFFRYYQGSLAYNTGTLVNANGRYIKCIGRQQWDEATESGELNMATGANSPSGSNIRSKNYIKVNPNTTYYYRTSSASIGLCYYDKDKTFISSVYVSANNSFNIPSNACYIRFYVGSACGTTYNHDITISIYYEDESGYDQYYPYQVLTNNDTGTETLRSAGSGENKKKDYKTPDGTIHRLVGNRDYQSGDENDSSLITDGTTTNYPLETPTTEQGTSFSENLVIDDFGSMDFQGTNGVPQGNLIFYPVDYKAFIDTLYDHTDGTPSNIALKSELSAEESARESVDTQLLNAIGGTLRQCLCVKESLDFEDTDFVDLGSLSPSYNSTWNSWQFILIANIKPAESNSTPAKILASNMKTVAASGYTTSHANNTVALNTSGQLFVDNGSSTIPPKGVLLAYEKGE